MKFAKKMEIDSYFLLTFVTLENSSCVCLVNNPLT